MKECGSSSGGGGSGGGEEEVFVWAADVPIKCKPKEGQYISVMHFKHDNYACIYINPYDIQSPFVKCRLSRFLLFFYQTRVINMTCNKQDYLLSIAYCLPLMPICSAIMDMGPGPSPRPKELALPGTGTAAPWAAPWASGAGPYPWWLSIWASRANDKQSIRNQ